jgi:hypothetical protein
MQIICIYRQLAAEILALNAAPRSHLSASNASGHMEMNINFTSTHATLGINVPISHTMYMIMKRSLTFFAKTVTILAKIAQALEKINAPSAVRITFADPLKTVFQT